MRLIFILIDYLVIVQAGMVSKLNTRCTILAATNPKGNYDRDQSLCVNTGLGSPLLSRFDLVFVLLDNHNAEWDRYEMETDQSSQLFLLFSSVPAFSISLMNESTCRLRSKKVLPSVFLLLSFHLGFEIKAKY
jgi:hypothetical protein